MEATEMGDMNGDPASFSSLISYTIVMDAARGSPWIMITADREGGSE